MKSNLKFLIVLVLLIEGAFTSTAQKRTEEAAYDIARGFLSEHSINQHKLESVSLDVVAAKAKRQSVNTPDLDIRDNGDGVYIISDVESHAFVLVGGDERMKKVLAYSLEGCFDVENIPDGAMDLINSYQRAFEQLQIMPEINTTVQNIQNYSVSSIEPLIKTKWDQEDPYNLLCPLLGDSRCASGCVATAMAQVLNYHRYPDSPKGSIRYQTNSGSAIESNLADIPLDWDNMSNVYGDNNTESQKMAVANLMLACGYSVYMDYGKSSGANPANIAYALINNFGYNANISFKRSDYYSSSEWRTIIDNELDNNRPILYGGFGYDLTGAYGGHRFVLDGRDGEGLYHMNFGWGGSFNGYYAVNPLIVQLFGYDVYNFTNNQSMVIGIVPETCGVHEDNVYASSFSISSLSNEVGSRTSAFIYRSLCCAPNALSEAANSATKFRGKIGVGVFDLNLNFIQSLFETDYELNADQYYYLKYGNIVFSPSIFTEGSQYNLVPYVRDNESGVVTRIRTVGGLEDRYLAKTNNGNVTLTVNGIPDEPDNSSATIENGYYNAIAYDITQGKKQWQISIWADPDDNTKYWIGGLDPIVSSMGYTYEKGWNKVYGILNNAGTKLTIPANQSVGENIVVRGQEDSDDIVFAVLNDGKMLSTSEMWGCYKGAEATELSRYEGTSFVYSDYSEIEVSKPIIVWDSSAQKITISTATENARILYTLDGSKPTLNSAIYQDGIILEHNCKVLAIAEKYGKTSEMAELNVSDFVVATPIFEESDEGIVITCSVDGANIYYTLDGSTPTTTSSLYTKPITLDQTTTIKAISVKENFNNSAVAEYTYFVEPVQVMSITVDNNEAGKLSDRINGSDKLNIEYLKISGNLNGDDIRLIREMVLEGKLSTINMTQANIVEGGVPYYESEYLTLKTKNNTIGVSMFSNMKNLVSLKLPSSVTDIETNSISSNNNLLELELPASCTKIGNLALSNNKRLPSVKLPAGIREFSAGVFSGCALLAKIDVDASSEYLTSIDGVVFTKDKKQLLWYSQCRDQASYIVPDGVEVIGSYCFNNSQLSKVILPEGLKIIEMSAFSYCRNLMDIDLPETLEKIGMLAFENCNLTNVDLKKISNLDNLAFTYNRNLTKVYIGCNLESLPGSAFNGCKQLKSFEVDESNPFLYSENGILFNRDITTLYKYPTSKISAVYNIPETVKIIDDYAFSGCEYVNQIIIGNSVEKIGISAFDDCKCQYIKMTSDCNVKTIGNMAFSSCDSLLALIIPDGVKEIPASCVSYSKSLEYLKIPAGIETISYGAFSGCKALKTIECDIKDFSAVDVMINDIIKETPFQGVNSECLWIVPEGSSMTYTSCPWWVGTWRIRENNNAGVNSAIVNDLLVKTIDGHIVILSPSDVTVMIYGLDGRIRHIAKCPSDTPCTVSLPIGIYIVNGHKYVVTR